jgi:hypothetical protein
LILGTPFLGFFWEKLEIDSNYLIKNIWLFVLYTFLGFTFNFLLNIGIFIATPIYISMGCLMILPCNFILDYIIRNLNYSIL